MPAISVVPAKPKCPVTVGFPGAVVLPFSREVLGRGVQGGQTLAQRLAAADSAVYLPGDPRVPRLDSAEQR